jgi:hypothetical protein
VRACMYVYVYVCMLGSNLDRGTVSLNRLADSRPPRIVSVCVCGDTVNGNTRAMRAKDNDSDECLCRDEFISSLPS